MSNRALPLSFVFLISLSSYPLVVHSTHQIGTGGGAQLYRFSCNIGGAQAVMAMQVEVQAGAGVFYGSDGRFAGSVADGGYTIYYGGELRGAQTHYTFIGENQFATFTDGLNGERFRVQFHMVPNGLVLVANPFSEQPSRYSCVNAGHG